MIIEAELIEILTRLAPESPVTEIASAIMKTIANPSVGVLLEDLQLAHKIATDIKTQVAGKPPALMNIVLQLLYSAPHAVK